VRRANLLFFALILGVHALTAQESTDDLFDTGTPDTTAPAEQVDLSVLTVQPTRFAGSMVSAAGGVVGLTRQGEFDATGLLSFDTLLSFDSRPFRDLHLGGTLSSVLQGSSFSTPALTELYFDYTFFDSALLRIGKQTLSWGQGRIFNPGNLLSAGSESVSLKAFVPFWSQGLTFAAISDAQREKDPKSPSWRELLYAAQFSGDLGPVGFGVAGSIVPGLSLGFNEIKGSAFVKTALLGFDVFAEGITSRQQPDFLVGFFWEGGTPRLRLQAEVTRTRVGGVLVADGLFGKPTLNWEQSLADGSGRVGVLANVPLVKAWNLVWAAGWTYGSDGEDYIVGNLDPNGRLLATALQLKFKSEF